MIADSQESSTVLARSAKRLRVSPKEKEKHPNHAPRTFECGFVARNGRKLVVVIVARISTDKQDPQSLKDQVAKAKTHIKSFYRDEIEYKVIASQGCGEQLDRQELHDLGELVESGTVNLVCKGAYEYQCWHSL